MSHSEDRHLEFVLKHYKEGAFDTQKAVERFRNAKGIKPKPRRRWIYAVSAVSVAAAVILGIFLFSGREASQWVKVTSGTAVLPDGTSVMLADGSSLSYRMEGKREIRMQGKVYFDVARDESRPFEITAGDAFVKVLGTEFMVDDTESGTVKVYVEEGRVLLAKDASSEGAILTDGMGATIHEASGILQVDEDPDVNCIAWQRGSFIFDRTLLKDVLTCLGEYYHVSFAATDLSKELSGEFYTDDLDLIISLIESALDVTIIRR